MKKASRVFYIISAITNGLYSLFILGLSFSLGTAVLFAFFSGSSPSSSTTEATTYDASGIFVGIILILLSSLFVFVGICCLANMIFSIIGAMKTSGNKSLKNTNAIALIVIICGSIISLLSLFGIEYLNPIAIVVLGVPSILAGSFHLASIKDYSNSSKNIKTVNTAKPSSSSSCNSSDDNGTR